MTSFSLSAFRDFCAAKPEGERYEPEDIYPAIASAPEHIFYPAADDLWFRPRTYGALTARLDALIEGEKK